jgi:AcrR family transcriptional regulator
MAARHSRDVGTGEQGADIAPTSPATLMPVTARGEATRRRILDAAEDVFGEMGYYEASVSEITRRAGVAQGTFYIYFHSKRETFVELIGDIGERLRAMTSAAIQDAPNRIEAERRGFAAFFRFVYEHRRIYRIVDDAGRVAPEAVRDYYQRISAGYERGLRAAIQVGQVRETNVEAIGYALMGIGHFLALRWIIWPAEGGVEPEPSTRQPPETIVPDAVFAAVLDFIAHGLSPEVTGG